MSIALGRTMNYKKYTLYSKYHPDSIGARPIDPLPTAVKGPSTVDRFSEIEKKINGAWGHSLTCEAPFGMNETRTRIKVDVAPKVGGSWMKTIMTEKGESACCSAMYGGSQIEMSCCEAANKVRDSNL